jgi:hypothetical protein
MLNAVVYLYEEALETTHEGGFDVQVRRRPAAAMLMRIMMGAEIGTS